MPLEQKECNEPQGVIASKRSVDGIQPVAACYGCVPIEIVYDIVFT